MNRTILVDGFVDAGYPGCVYQIPIKYEVDIKVCDICEEEIAEGERLRDDSEDFCLCCYENGKVERYYIQIMDEEAPLFLKHLKDQYDAIQLRKLPKR